MAQQWYYSRDGKEHGPLSSTVLFKMAKKGDLLPTDLLRKEGTEKHRPAADFQKLFAKGEIHPSQAPQQVAPPSGTAIVGLSGSRFADGDPADVPQGQSIDPASADPSSLKGLTMALGIEPAKPGHDPLLGCDIGGVTIIRLIAEGGMGRVYEGKQEKPSRNVAVKVMRPGLTSPSILRRFEYEAEVLGRLQHPGIAHIYSVGVHRMGNASVPYFIMEYIADARTLTKYANDLKLPARQRLDLFRSVCDAVAHGHQKGVIHRDLKPSNILVDGSGQPKVIDFGVARATDSDMALTTMQTDVGQLIGTLQYMSPEQFRADPNDIDVRSDVYALGVILYELLAGKMPYDVKKKAIHEVARIVQEDDPKPLSSFNRALKGDVAVIAGKCLEKERCRRYSSASELGSDIGRYLTGEPISASPPGFVDGLIRLAKKHRAAATALVAVAVTLVAAMVGVSYFALKASKERTIAVRERQRAEENNALAISQAKVAESQTQLAMEAEDRAVAEARSAKERLYVANLYRIAGLISENAIAFARQLLDETSQLSPPGLEPLEIRCLRSQFDQSLVTIGDQSTSVPIAAFSPSGALVVTVNKNNTAQVWRADTGKTESFLKGHAAGLTAVAFGVDDRICATASLDGTARLWDTKTGREVMALTKHLAPITAVTFSPDGSRLATASVDKTARLWDAITGAEIATLQGHSDAVIAVGFMPDGARVVTASHDRTARVWRAQSGEQLTLMQGHWGRLRGLAISRDGTRVAAVASTNERNDNDEATRVWDATSGQPLMVVEKSHPQGTFAVVFSDDATQVVTAGGDNLAKVWRVSDGKRVATLKGHNGPVVSLALSRDGARLATASADGTTRVWETATWEDTCLLKGHESGIACVAFNADRSRVVTASYDQTSRIWTTDKTDEPVVLKGHAGWVFAVTFSPDGERLATGSWDRKVRLWDAAAAKEIASFDGHAKPVNSVAFSPDGCFLASGSDDGTVRLWDVVVGGGGPVITGTSAVNGVAFSPDGKYLATASHDKAGRVWEVAGWREVRVLRGHEGQVYEVAFSPDGSQIVTASEDATARIWDTATGVERQVLKGHRAGLKDIAFSPDGRVVASGSFDRTVRLWEVGNGKQIAVLDHRTHYPIELAFTPDGKRIVTGGTDNNARIWDSLSGKELEVLIWHQRPICAIAISPDGSRFASGSGDLTARLWGVSNAAIYRVRQEDEEVAQRLAQTVSEWLEHKPDEIRTRLDNAKAHLTPGEYRVVARMILEAHSNGQQKK